MQDHASSKYIDYTTFRYYVLAHVIVMLRLYLFVGDSDQESRLHKYKELIIISFTQFEINKFLMFVFVVY